MKFISVLFLVLCISLSNCALGQLIDTSYTLFCTNQELNEAEQDISRLNIKYKTYLDSASVEIDFVGKQSLFYSKSEIYLVDEDHVIPLNTASIDKKGFYAPVHSFFGFNDKALSLFHLPSSGVGVYVSDLEVTELVRGNRLLRKIIYVEFNSSGFITRLALRSAYSTYYYISKADL